MKKQTKPQVTKFSYNFMDANRNFVNVLLWPVVLSLLPVIALVIMSAATGVSIETLQNTVVFRYILQYYHYFVLAVLFVLYHKKHAIMPLAASKFVKKLEPFRVAVVLLLSGICIFLLSPFIGLLDHLFGLMGYTPTGSLPFPLTNPWELLLVLFTLAVIPAAVEEFFFRGVVLNGLRNKFTLHRAVLWSAIMFMFLHGALQQTVYQIMLGVVLGYVAVFSGNLVYAILLHFMNNAVVVLLAYFSQNAATQTVSFVSFTDFAMPVVLLVIAITLSVALLWLLKFSTLKDAFAGLKQLSKGQVVKKQEKNIIFFQKAENEQKTTLVIELNEKPKTIKNLTSYEKKVFFLGLLFALVLWVLGTISSW